MFFDQLLADTDNERRALFGIPVIQRALRGDVTRADYLAFLGEAYHHVRHTVPLLMLCGARLPDHLDWLRTAIVDYVEEEIGHEEWILTDIDRAGGDAAAIRHGMPGHATEIMVAYAYDSIQRRNPLAFFGMAHVLEGTSVQLATQAADELQRALDLPPGAFTYLASHGAIDIDHTRTFADLMNRVERDTDRHAVTHAARAFYRLYGDIFRNIDKQAA